MSYNDFKVVINSRNAIEGSVNNSQLSYYFNWDMFPDGCYQVEATFVAGTNDISPSCPAELCIDFGARSYSAGNSSSSSQHICMLYPNYSSLADDGYLRSNSYENSPTIVSRPHNNRFTVSIYNLNGELYTDNALFPIANYLLVLKFRFLQLNN